MILGRPTNLWLGLSTAVVGFIQLLVINVVPDVDAMVAATIFSALAILLGAIITLVANQPPALNPGDPFTVVTPAGTANETRTA